MKRAGGPYNAVVDGRPLTWAEFGLELEPIGGWEFRLSFRPEDVDAEDAVIATDAARSSVTPAPLTDARVH